MRRSVWILCVLVATLLVSDSAAAKKRRRGAPRRAAPVPALTGDGRPNVQSVAAIVVDLDTGVELYAKNPDDERFIASTSKIFVAMVVRGKGIPLDGQTTINEVDRKWARGGAKSRLLEGRTFRHHDLMRAMLIGSDNRACTALGRGAGMTPEELIEAMNAKAAELGLKVTRFTDPSGLRGNVSTAREMAVALKAALEDPVIAEIMRTREYTIHSTDKKRVAVGYRNTNHSLFGKWAVIGGKTGFTDPAKYCLVIAARFGKRRIGAVFLGADGELTRFADFSRVAQWVDEGGPEKTPPPPAAPASQPRGVGSMLDPPPEAVTPQLVR